MKDLPQRKNNRLKGYDYSQGGAYFVTFCVGKRYELLGKVVGSGFHTLQSVVGQIKSYTTKRWNEMGHTNYLTFWQKSYYDHIIRNEDEYRCIWQYIEENPQKWTEDRYYDA